MSNCQEKNKSVLSNQISEGQRVVELSEKTKLMKIVDMNQVHFQEETLMDILSRLPVRSLLRFKCVSKYLKTLIDDPIFRKQHLNRAKNDQNSQKFLFYTCLLLEDRCTISCYPLSSDQQVGVRELDFPSNLKPQYCDVYCCCDGLVIIKVYENSPGRYSFLLWNPSTGESIELPTSKFSSVEEYSTCYGISFDSTNDDYKILRIPKGWNEYCRDVPGEILSLKSGYWRKIDAYPSKILSRLYGIHSLTIIHGAFHWVAMSRDTCFVVSFNISHEVFGEIIPLPEKMWLANGHIGVSELGGMLCAYTNGYYQRKRTFKLWVLKDYGLKDSWNEVISIVDPDIIIASPKYKFPDGEVLIWCEHFEGEEGEGNSFRTQRGPFTLLPRGNFQNGFAFTESLISPRLLIT
ncbi:F-box protein CPR1-like [Solanum stenotomum]|uniref:F-box protein CPR1-like n=1 Tax=Solanum stenotomum TaxID=172797 RepID=UPI0020D10DAB|nr:F-box protein CPR1-like [Solanum stenotomum]